MVVCGLEGTAQRPVDGVSQVSTVVGGVGAHQGGDNPHAIRGRPPRLIHGHNLGRHITDDFETHNVPIQRAVVGRLVVYFDGKLPNGSYNPCRRNGRAWVAASFRSRVGYFPGKGRASAWKHESGACAVVFASLDDADFVISYWGIDNVTRNKLMHALNGNKKRDKSRDVRAEVARAAVDEQDAARHEDEVVARRTCQTCGAGFDVTRRQARKAGNKTFKHCRDCQEVMDSFRMIAEECAVEDESPDGSDDVSVGAPVPEICSIECDGCYGNTTAHGHGFTHLGGHGTLMPGDVVITREFCEVAGADYLRLGPKFEFVQAVRMASAGDWLFDPVPVHTLRCRDGCMRRLFAKRVEFSDDKYPGFAKFEIEETLSAALPQRHRYRQFTYRFGRYSCFRGSVSTMLECNGERTFVPSDAFGECLKYYMGDLSAKVCTSHILGHLKNNPQVSEEQCRAMIYFCCAVHDSKAVEFYRHVNGAPLNAGRIAAAKAGGMNRKERLWSAAAELFRIPRIPSDDQLLAWALIACCVAWFVWFVHTTAQIYSGAMWVYMEPDGFVRCHGDLFGYNVSQFGVACDQRYVANVSSSGVRFDDFLDAYALVLNVILLTLFFDVFCAARYEETIKQFHWSVVWLIIGFEASHHHFSVRYLPTAFMHVACYFLGIADLTSAKLLHMCFNVYATGVHRWIFFIASVGAGNPRMDYDFIVDVLMKEYHFSLRARGLMFVCGFVWTRKLVRWLAGYQVYVTAGAPIAGSLGWYLGTAPFVEPMGMFSRFVEYFRTGLVSYKVAAQLRVQAGRRCRGVNRLRVLMPLFVGVRSFASNTANALHSCVGRVLKVTPLCYSATDSIRRALEAMADRMGRVYPVSFEEWVTSFPPAKRNRYRYSAERLQVFDMRWFNRPFGLCTKWFKRSCFLKHEANFEVLDKRVDGGRVAGSDPRTIQASTDEVQVALGPYMVAYGRAAGQVFDGSESSAVEGIRLLAAFGRTKAEIATVVRDLLDAKCDAIVDCGDDALIIWKGLVYAVDAARWDAHVGPELLRLKKYHYRRLGMPHCLVRLFERMVRREGNYKFLGVQFKLDGDVASGDPDTLYWNTMLGMAILLVCMINSNDFEELCERSKEFGIVYELAGSSVRTYPGASLDFCSCVMAPTATGWTFAPKLGRALMKLSVGASGVEHSLLLAQKIQGLSCDLCVYPEVVLHLRSLLPMLPAAGPIEQSYVPVGKAEPGSFESRDLFFGERYGVGYGAVVDEVARWVSDARSGEYVGGSYPVLRKLAEVDYGKPAVHPVEPLVLEPRKHVSELNPYTLPPWPSGWKFRAILTAVVAIAICCYSCSAFEVVGGAVKTFGGFGVFFESNVFMAKKAQNNNKKVGPRSKGQATKRLGQQGALMQKLSSQVKGLASRLAKTKLGPMEAIGQAAGKAIGGFFGTGDYVVNDIVHQRGTAGKMKRGVESNVIVNCEYVRDIVSTGQTGFALTSSNVNAAENTLFPWLSNVSKLYTKYRFKQLIFEYRSMSSDYASGVGLGTVIMAPQYNPEAANFGTKQAMEAATHAVSFKPSNSAMMGFECAAVDNNVKWYNIRGTGDAASVFTDPGRFSFALAGVPTTVAAGTTLGELWVWYTVELIEPVLGLTTAVTSSKTFTWETQDTAPGVMQTPFGWRLSSAPYPRVVQESAFGITNYQNAVWESPIEPPTGGNDEWLMAFPNADATGFATSVYFSRPGDYVVFTRMRFSTPPTALSTVQPFELSAAERCIVRRGSGDLLGAMFSADRTEVVLAWRVQTESITSKFTPARAVWGWTSATQGVPSTVLQQCLTTVVFTPA